MMAGSPSPRVRERGLGGEGMNIDGDSTVPLLKTYPCNARWSGDSNLGLLDQFVHQFAHQFWVNV